MLLIFFDTTHTKLRLFQITHKTTSIFENIGFSKGLATFQNYIHKPSRHPPHIIMEGNSEDWGNPIFSSVFCEEVKDYLTRKCKTLHAPGIAGD